MLFESAVFWILLGFVLIGVEIFALNMILVFFGVGALVVAALTALGLIDSLAIQLLVFAAVSLCVLFTLRRRFRAIFSGTTQRGGGGADDTGLAGRHATVTSEFSNGCGEVELGGTGWKAICESGASFKVGDTVRVTGSKGINLLVEPVTSQN